jgi:hypothetical protein
MALWWWRIACGAYSVATWWTVPVVAIGGALAQAGEKEDRSGPHQRRGATGAERKMVAHWWTGNDDVELSTECFTRRRHHGELGSGYNLCKGRRRG